MNRKISIFAGLAVVFVVLLCSWSWRRLGAKEMIRATGIPESGLVLAPINDSSIGTLASGTPDPRFESLKMYSVALENHSTKNVVAYAVRWELTSPDGSVSHINIFDGRADDFTVAGEPKPLKTGPGVAPQSLVIVTPVGVKSRNQDTTAGVNPSGPDTALTERVVSRLSRATMIDVTLDGAFFQDGTFVGPDKAGFFDRFISDVSAKHALALQVVSGVEAGRRMEDIVAEVRNSMLSPDQRPISPRSGSSASEWQDYYKQKYSWDLLSFYQRHGRQAALAWALRNVQNHPTLVRAEDGSPK